MKPDFARLLLEPDGPEAQLRRLKRRCRLWHWVEVVAWVGIAAYLLIRGQVL